MHFRQLARLLSRRTWLWTEMAVDKAIVHTDNRDKLLWFPPEQRPVVCQLGGSSPAELQAAAALVAAYGYDAGLAGPSAALPLNPKPAFALADATTPQRCLPAGRATCSAAAGTTK